MPMNISPGILEEAASRYGTAGRLLTHLGGSQNAVYSFLVEERPYILRLTSCANRSVGLVEAELEWILYLAERGIPASKPIRSISGCWTELLEHSEGSYVCAAFERAPGRSVHYPECLQDNTLYEKLGELTGKLHALSRGYRTHDGSLARHDWTRNWFLRSSDLLPPSHDRVRGSLSKLMNEISELPKDDRSFGLLHGDIGVGNFTVDERGIITLFDFDEAQYSWFIEDIAIQLYYLVYVYGDEIDGKTLREEQASRFMTHFMKGYLRENDIDAKWLRHIPLFLRLRELIVYIGSFRYWDGDETFSSSGNQWLIDWIAESRARIENGISIVDIWSGS